MAGRPNAVRNVSVKEEYELVCRWVETGNYAQVAREFDRQRETVTKAIKRWILNNPEAYQKMLDAFEMRNKQELIFKNTHITTKALNKVDDLLDGDDMVAFKNAAMGYGILYDKGALMKGESTSNSAIVIKMAGNIEELSK